MPLSPALKTFGGGMGAVARGLQQIPELADKEEELAYKRAERPLTLEEAKLRLQKTRQDLEHPKPITTPYGLWQRDPQTSQYKFEPLPEDIRKHSAKEAEMGILAQWLNYPEGSPQRRYAEAYLGKMQAPALSAQARADLVDPRKQQWQAQQRHWRSLEGIARGRNQALEKHYGDQARYWEGLLNLREQAGDKDPTEVRVLERIGEMLQSQDPQERALAQQWLERKNVPVVREQRQAEREPLVLEKLEAQVQQLQAKLDPNDPRTQLELKRLDAQVKNLRSQTIERTAKGDREQLEFPDKLKRLQAQITDLTNRTLERTATGERQEEAHQLSLQSGEEKLKQLRQKGGVHLDQRLTLELERLEQQVAALKGKSETLGPYLKARLQKLEESIEQARSREQRSEAKASREAQIAPLREQDMRGRIKGREGAHNEISIQDGMTTHRLRGKDVDLFQTFMSRFTGDAKRDAATLQNLPRHHERLIARLAYQEKYKKALPPDTGPVPKEEAAATPQTPQPDALSAAEITEELRQIGMPEPGSSGDTLVQEFLGRLKKMPVEEAVERYKRLTSAEQKHAFKLAFLDVYKRRPPE